MQKDSTGQTNLRGKTQPRKHKTLETKFNDEKKQTTLFETTQYYITTPKFEKLRMEIKLKMLQRALEEEELKA